LIDGESPKLDDVFVLWSDDRSWKIGAAPEKPADGILRIPAMRAGANSVLLVKLDGDRATHFSAITEFQLAAGQSQQIDVPLRASRRIVGALSPNVPRPIRNGRVKLWTLPPRGANHDRVSWFTWAPIRADGTFAVEGWPADEPLQLIALCDGFIATSGKAPEAVANPPDPAQDGFNRPQVFDPAPGETLKVSMASLVSCNIQAVDEEGEPVAGVTISSWPNVGWWNYGSQVYCDSLVRSERRLKARDYSDSIDVAFPQPFQGRTDAEGRVTLELPAGSEHLVVLSDIYELPVFVGRRDVEVELTSGEPTDVVLRLQARGTEKLGEWDKLAGVVFGCSTREGRRICALPGVQKRMEEFARRFREAKNQRDPKLLSEAYSAVAEAFAGVGDVEEAAKWREKAAEQAAKAKALSSP
jgi:hypothetical protein